MHYLYGQSNTLREKELNSWLIDSYLSWTSSSAIGCNDILGPVRALEMMLHSDLDERYHPGTRGVVQHNSTPLISRFSRYTRVYPALFISECIYQIDASSVEG
mmetsp:Transcript_23762/g.57298  ORF Transcript_23762/g.57298 Transcript_23762/m.57298 type:complete len:103 (+) Transcript_23762:540-848(+)